ncbi:MAG TPA: MBL fold metallo-hydrolase [Steroidobacteraceae bacterium]|nr:MBL fold metallo-hydrolase [Steroidobacteraceae bacterium]
MQWAWLIGREAMKIEFHGADRSVTGSCHLIECGGTRVLIDCGLYQGGRELDEENAQDFGFDPGEIDFVLLTHGHLDHCGRLPLLVKRGFHGGIITTGASRELLRLMLLDAAHLHEEEALRRARHSPRRGVPGSATPLYTIADALHTMDFVGLTAQYDIPMRVAPGITATFLDASHILGSASILLELAESGVHRRVLFSGDIGNAGRPLLRPAPPPPRVDVVIMESTYGDRLHKPIGPSIEELYQAITAAFARGGNVVIPSFALERAQELLFCLRTGIETGRLPHTLQVFLDSPMAISATGIFARYPECYEPEVRELFRAGGDPFALPGLHLTRETSESVALNRITGGAIIIAGSGMCTGGRVRHHLRHNLGRHNCAVIFVGYAGRGTLARRIIDGAESVTLFGEEIPVRARIHTINGFSAHADQAELLRWHAATHAPRTYLVHGDPEVMERCAERLQGTAVEMPVLHQQYGL